MGALRTIAAVVLSISLLVFVALFGRLPTFRKTPIGWLYRAVCVHAPNGLVSLDRAMTGGRVTSNLQRFFNYIMNEPHPLVMIFFILLQSIGELLFIPPALPLLTNKVHYVLMPTLVALPYISLYYCYTVSSTVTASKHSGSVAAYPYDYILYHPRIDCRTCHFPKPARSKHCSICNVCVQKQDHHCIWINNCVGRNNVIWFMAMLLSISALLLYASLLGYSILDSLLQARFVPPELVRGSFTAKRWSTRMDWYQYMNAWGVAIAINSRIGGTTMLCMMCFPLSTAFCIYHVYLLWAGMTTNESAKWNDLKEDVHDGLVWKAKIDAIRVDHSQKMDEKLNPGSRFWPHSPEWWVIRTRGGRQPLRQVWAGEEGEQEPDHRWHRVRSMKYDIDNVYDVGFWANVKDMFINRE